MNSFGENHLESLLRRGSESSPGNRMEFPGHAIMREQHAQGGGVGGLDGHVGNTELAHFNTREMRALKRIPGMVKDGTAVRPSAIF